MSFFSQFAGGPAKITSYTSGTGNFTPISTNQSWARITIVGGGAGGAGGNSSRQGGKSGATYTWWQKLNLSSYAYSVGAGGTSSTSSAGNAGGNTRFGSITALGAGSGNQTWIAVAGAGYMQNNPSSVNYANNLFPQNVPLGGITQASGGAQGPGVPGYEVTNLGGGGNNGQGQGAGSGGAASMYGLPGNGGYAFTGGDGNTPTAGNAATGFGAGGGGGALDNNNQTVATTGGAGSGGVIIIEEFIQ